MKIEQNIQKIALIFFFAIGIIHIIAYLMLLNGFLPGISLAVKQILEIPFILTAAVYGFISLRLSLATSEKKHKISNIIFILFIIALFAATIYLNLFIPDRI